MFSVALVHGKKETQAWPQKHKGCRESLWDKLALLANEMLPQTCARLCRGQQDLFWGFHRSVQGVNLLVSFYEYEVRFQLFSISIPNYIPQQKMSPYWQGNRSIITMILCVNFFLFLSRHSIIM